MNSVLVGRFCDFTEKTDREIIILERVCDEQS